MKKRAHHSTNWFPPAKPEKTLKLADLTAYSESWIRDGDFSNRSSHTLEARRRIVGKLTWFLAERKCSVITAEEVRAFLSYLKHGHEEDGGRWDLGDERATLRNAPRPSTVKTYFAYLRAFFTWCVKQGYVDRSPITAIPTPQVPHDDIQPFTLDEKLRLIVAAKESKHPKRDEALLKLLLGTGLRASEVCSVNVSDVNMDERLIGVVGKGDKKRTVPFGRKVAKAMWNYIKDEPRHIEAREKGHSVPLFISDRGKTGGEALTRFGVSQLIRRLNEFAKVDNTRCSPHTFRHTFAVDYLRKGGNVFALKRILGHTNLEMTNRYVSYADNDLAKLHRQYCPVDDL